MTEDVRAVTVSALAADGALVTTPHVAEEIAAAGLSEIQLAFDNATALLAVISQDWEKSAAETLEPKPASPTEPSAVSVRSHLRRPDFRQLRPLGMDRSGRRVCR